MGDFGPNVPIKIVSEAVQEIRDLKEIINLLDKELFSHIIQVGSAGVTDDEFNRLKNLLQKHELELESC